MPQPTNDDAPQAGPAIADDATVRARLAAIVESSDDAIIGKTLDGVITSWNRGAERIFGYAASDAIGRPVTMLIPLDRHDEEPEILGRIRRGERVDHYETIRQRRDGSLIHVSLTISPILDATGAIVGASKVARDISDRVRTGQLVARMAAIVESSDDAIVGKTLDGVITSWNRSAERIFGYSAAEAIGHPVTMLIPTDRHDEEPDILGRVRRGERVDHYQTVRIRKDGTPVDISLSVSPIADETGTIIGASKIARDISNQKRTEAQHTELLREAQDARASAEAANRAKDEFLAMLGHELRNPLSAVRNALAAAMLDPIKRERALEIARRQTDQLARIVDDLLDVARITKGRVPLRKAHIALGPALRRSVDGAQFTLLERQHTLALDVPDETILVNADSDRLQQAIGNLLSNAAKYTNPGGTITVGARRDGDAAVISVRDTGIGIAADLLPRVFDLFRQGARTLHRAEGGLGIGLTLVRSIVELHGGSVEARSPGLDLGAEFLIRLPALPCPSDGPSETTVDSRNHPRAKSAARILMVEDNPDAAESLQMLLELLGHHVRVIDDGNHALGAARANIPDVMLIDIGLPGMDGYEIATAIRRDPALRNLVLVALTGYGRPEDRNRAMAAGFDYHLVKPVDVGTLEDLLDRLAPSAVKRSTGDSSSVGPGPRVA